MLKQLVKRTRRLLYSAPIFNVPKNDRLYRLAVKDIDTFTVAFRENTADEHVLASSFVGDIYFPLLRNIKVAPNAIILDVGAHIGTFALLAATKVPQGRVFAIEACQDTYNLLRINLALNSCNNITPSRVALAGARGPIKLYHSDANWGHSIVCPRSTGSEAVQGLTLEDFMSQQDIAYCDLARFNCEGAEFEVILSADVETLKKFGTMLLMYHCDLAPRYTPEMIVARLTEAGFTVSITRQNGQRGWLIATRS